MKKDASWEWIERNVTVPVISHDWTATAEERFTGHADRHGRIEEFRKVRDEIVRRRRALSTDSELHSACDEALALVKDCRAGGFTHEILNRIATRYERVNGKINPMVQAVIRDAMFKVISDERVDR